MPATLAVDRFYDVGGVCLHTVEWGDRSAASAVVMLHGVGGNAQSFNTLGPRLAAAGPGRYRAISLDQRGSGSSDQPAAGYDIDAFADDVAAICAVEGIRTVTLVGHSRGGWLAAYLAGTRPELVGALVLIDPARIAFASEDDTEDFYRGVRAMFGPFPSYEAAIEAGRGRDRQAKWTAERQTSFVAGLVTRPDGSVVNRTSPQVLDQLRAARQDGDKVRAAVAAVTAPTLMFVSTKAAPARQAQKLEYAKLISGVRVEPVDATHSIHQDEPDVVAARILAFLAECEGAR